ncbi:MAG: hypothetical protein ABI882_07490 [Acidobacteriota bacterium]
MTTCQERWGGMNKWEYLTVDWGEIRKIGSRVTGEDFIDANVDAGLNSLGREGWELASVYVDGYAVHRSNKGEELLSSSRYVKYTFKRKIGD